MSKIDDQEIRAEWKAILRLQASGRPLQLRLASMLAEQLEAEGVTDEDIDRLFPSATSEVAPLPKVMDRAVMTKEELCPRADKKFYDFRPWSEKPTTFASHPEKWVPSWIPIFRGGAAGVAFRPVVCWSQNQVERIYGQQLGYLGAFNLQWLWSLSIQDWQDGWPKGEVPDHGNVK